MKTAPQAFCFAPRRRHADPCGRLPQESGAASTAASACGYIRPADRHHHSDTGHHQSGRRCGARVEDHRRYGCLD